jgi:hypothetical protein
MHSTLSYLYFVDIIFLYQLGMSPTIPQTLTVQWRLHRNKTNSPQIYDNPRRMLCVLPILLRNERKTSESIA